MAEGVVRLAETYAAFADQEAVGRSALYVAVCRGIAGDHPLLERLAGLPLEKQQPNLLLAAVKYLFGVTRDWPNFRELVHNNWPALEAIILARRTQTNEPARCATLLPLLARLPQPLALLEVGASAGLCLLPDKYAYDYGRRSVTPTGGGTDAPVFHCAVNAATPIPERNVQVAWRAGLDLNPLDISSEEDVRWLEALVWPGEGDRQRLLGEALAIARRDPPRVVRGDLRRDLSALAAQAPRQATLVIFHTAVLAYVQEAADRLAFADAVHSLNAQWISNESAKLLAGPDDPPAPWGRFLLALNGRPVAYTDPHGASVDWLA